MNSWVPKWFGSVTSRQRPNRRGRLSAGRCRRASGSGRRSSRPASGGRRGPSRRTCSMSACGCPRRSGSSSPAHPDAVVDDAADVLGELAVDVGVDGPRALVEADRSRERARGRSRSRPDTAGAPAAHGRRDPGGRAEERAPRAPPDRFPRATRRGLLHRFPPCVLRISSASSIRSPFPNERRHRPCREEPGPTTPGMERISSSSRRGSAMGPVPQSMMWFPLSVTKSLPSLLSAFGSSPRPRSFFSQRASAKGRTSTGSFSAMPQSGDQLLLAGDRGERPQCRGDDLLAEEGAAPALDQVEPRVDLVRAVDRGIERVHLGEGDELDPGLAGEPRGLLHVATPRTRAFVAERRARAPPRTGPRPGPSRGPAPSPRG